MQMKLYKQIKLFLLDNRVGYHVLNDKMWKLLIAAFDDPSRLKESWRGIIVESLFVQEYGFI